MRNNEEGIWAMVKERIPVTDKGGPRSCGVCTMQIQGIVRSLGAGARIK
jgi:hypothetical protein